MQNEQNTGDEIFAPPRYDESYILALLDALAEGRITAANLKTMSREARDEFMDRVRAEEKSAITEGLGRHQTDKTE